MKQNKKNCLRQAVVAVMFIGLGASAQAADELVLVNNQVTIGGNLLTVDPATGVVPSTTVGTAYYGIPDIIFSLDAGTVADGIYSFRIGLTLDDDDSADRIEMLIPALELTITAGEITSGGVDKAQKASVLARHDGITLSATPTPPDNALSVSGNQITFKMAVLVNAINSKHQLIKDILKNLDVERNYSYRVMVEGTGLASGIALALEGAAGGLLIVDDIAGDTAFILNNGALGGLVGRLYILTGKYSVSATANPPAPEVPADIEGQTSDLGNQVSSIVIPSTGPVPAAVVAQVNDAVAAASQLAQDAAEAAAEGNLPVPTALAAVQAVNNALAVAADASQKGADINTAQAIQALDNVADLLAAIGNNPNLTPAEQSILDSETVKAVASVADLVTGNTTAEQALAILAVTGELIEGSLAASGDVSEELLGALLAVIDATLVQVVGIAPLADGVDLSNADALIALLSTSPSVLQFLIDTGMSVGEMGDAFTIRGLTAEQLIAATLQGNSIFGSQIASRSVMTASSAGPVVESDPLSQVTTIAVGDEAYSGMILGASIVSDQIPLGLRFLPDGRVVFVNSGYAVQMSAMAINVDSFLGQIDSFNYDVELRDNGTFEILLGGSEHVSAAFAYDNLGGADIAGCGNMTIADPVGALNSPGYAFTAVCDNGITQRITPAVDSPLFYTTVINSKLEVTTDRNTGIVTVPGVGSFKPHFFVSTLSASDQTYLNTNKNAEGVVFRAVDANGDGLIDYEFLTLSGKQVFFAVQ